MARTANQYTTFHNDPHRAASIGPGQDSTFCASRADRNSSDSTSSHPRGRQGIPARALHHRLPKPLLPVGDRAILDVVVHQLRDCGFGDLTLAVGYLAHLVRAVMGDGSRHGVQHRLPRGDRAARHGRPAGRRSTDLDDTFLVMNGDVLTALDYGAPLDVHRETGNVLTIASHRRVVRTEYGVLHFDEQAGETSARRPASRRSPRSRTW